VTLNLIPEANAGLRHANDLEKQQATADHKPGPTTPVGLDYSISPWQPALLYIVAG